MTRTRFHQNLDDLKEKLLVMAGMAEQATQRAIEAYRVGDVSICDLVMRSEPAINRMERDIDQMALDLLAMEQPMAIDLRFILSVIKINADLERVGDRAVKIAERVRDLQTVPPVELPVDIPKLATLAATMVRNALQAFIDGDAALAERVLLMDDEVDELNRAIFHTLTRYIQGQARAYAAGPERGVDCAETWNEWAITPPTSPKMSSSGCAVRMFGTILRPASCIG